MHQCTSLTSLFLVFALLLSPTISHSAPQSTSPVLGAKSSSPPSLIDSIIAASPLLTSLVGNSIPPLMTNVHSPECEDINRGTLMCCASELDGGNDAVQLLAGLVGYDVTESAVNGFQCQKSVEKCEGRKLCCEVVVLTPLLGLYCAHL